MYIDVDHNRMRPRELYQLIISTVTPRPIAFVSTVSAEGARNLAPFSFFNCVSVNPLMMMFCPARKRDAARKDTLVNVEATGEFVINIVNKEIAVRMHQTSAPYPPEIDEFEIVGLTPVASSKVKPPRVAESPASFECVLDRIIEFGDHPGAGCMVLGRVVAFHVDDECLTPEGTCDPAKLQTIGRMGGTTYARTTDRFDLPPAVLE